MRLAIPAGTTEVSSALLTPLDHLGARFCLLYLPSKLTCLIYGPGHSSDEYKVLV